MRHDIFNYLGKDKGYNLKSETLKLYLINIRSNLVNQIQDPDKANELEEKIKPEIGGFEFLGAGRNRFVFRKPESDWVIKVPINEYGMLDNDSEDIYFHRHQTGFMARCKLIQLCDVPILVMEYVDINLEKKDMPDWSAWVDCQQVGRNKNGKIVAYDYANGAI